MKHVTDPTLWGAEIVTTNEGTEKGRRNKVLGMALTAGATLLGAAAIWAMSNVPAASQTAGEEAPFEERVRQVLLKNPEIILEVFSLLEEQQGAQEEVKDRNLIASVADELFEGLDLSKPILIEFQDYNCGYCRRAHGTVTALQEQYPDLQVVIMEFPILGEGSKFAAEAALAIKLLKGFDAYKRFAHALMSIEGPADQSSVNRLIQEQGHQVELIRTAMKGGVGQEELRKAQNLAAKIGATGTPYFVGPSGIARGAASVDRLASIAAPQTSSEESTELQN